MKNVNRILLIISLIFISAFSVVAQGVPTTHDSDNLNSIAKDLRLIGEASGIPPRNTDTTLIITPAEHKPSFIRRIINYYSQSNVDYTFAKKIDWSIAPGPNYSSDIGLGLGFLLAGLYRIDRTDSITAPSNISVYGNFTTKKFVMLRASGENIYRHNKERLSYSGAFVYFPGAFYGVGNEDGKRGYAQSLTTTMAVMRASYCYAFWPRLYLGVSGGIDYSGASYEESHIGEELNKIKESVDTGGAIPEGKIGELYSLWTQGKYNPAAQDPFSNYIAFTGQNPNAFNTHIGIFAQYDTRDVSFNAHKGVFLKLEGKWYPRFLGNTRSNFGRLTFTFNFYQKLWKGAVLAYDLYADAIIGIPSWHMYAKLGGMERMRGYYEGRYRDKRLAETQLELRQKIYRRHGVVGWFGLGNIWGRDSFQWRNTLYSFGFGYRFEFKNRMNIRLDYGWGVYGNQNLPWDKKRSSAFLFTASEAF